MKYCKDCKFYEPNARYAFEMRDPKMRKCKHLPICNRIVKLVEKQPQQLKYC